MYFCIGMKENSWHALLLAISFIPWILLSVVTGCFVISIIYGRRKLYQISNRDICDDLPGVSIIKPLMGADVQLKSNLESHFKLEYAEFELLFCVQNEKDPACEVVYNLQEQYPHVNSKIFFGGKGILNPLVDNMAPAYEACKYELVWISTSRVKATTNAIMDMVEKINRPNVAFVHQMPFTANFSGFAANVEKIYFGTVVPKYYFVSDLLGIVCITGMSYLVKKSELDAVNGLLWYGRYMAEDFFMAKALHNKGFVHILSAFPVEQNAETTISSFTERMIRWQKLRVNMLPVVAGILEPLGECIPLCLFLSWSTWYHFDVSPCAVFSVYIIAWCCLDYIQLKGVQRGPLPFGLLKYVSFWSVRQILFLYIYISALLYVRLIKWGGRRYRLSNFGRSLQLATRRGIFHL